MKKIRFTCLFLATFPAAVSTISAQSIITTAAGNGSGGYSGDGVAATTTSVNSPWGVASDKLGNIYIGDSPNNRVRKVSVTGIITTIGGTGTYGFSGDGFPATSAEIGNPSGVAVDGAGNVYIADNGNSRIRKINTAGIISTIGGSGAIGYSGDGMAATAAKIFPPDGLAADSMGNVYISTAWGVRKIDTFGIITTIAGNGAAGFSGDGGPATAAMVGQSSDIKVDKYGNVFFTDFDYHCVRKVDATGIITTLAGNSTIPGFSGDGGPATAAMLHSPVGVDVDDAGNVYIGDRDNSRIRKISPSGIISTIAGTGTAGYSGDGIPATSADIKAPHAVTHDACGNIYFCDRLNNRIRKIADPVMNFAGIITGKDSVCPGDTIYLSDAVSGGTWSLVHSGIAHITPTGAVSGILPGTDTVVYTITRPCGTDTVAKLINVRTVGCIPEIVTTAVPETRIVVYPSPANEEITISYTDKIQTIVITNLLGQVVYNGVHNADAVVVSVGGLPPGVYLAKINGQKITKFIKE